MIKSDIICISCKSKVCKTAWMRTVCIPRLRIEHRKFCDIFTFLWSVPALWPISYGHPLTGNGQKAVIISENFQCLILNLRTCNIVIHTIFWKFSKLRLRSPSGPIRYTSIEIIVSSLHVSVCLHLWSHVVHNSVVHSYILRVLPSCWHATLNMTYKETH